MADGILKDMLIETSPIANAAAESVECERAKILPAKYLFRPGRIPGYLTYHVDGDYNHFVMYTLTIKRTKDKKTGEVTKVCTKIPHATDGGPTSATGYVKKRNPDGTVAKSPDGSDELVDMTHTWVDFKTAVDTLCKDLKGDGPRKFDGIGYVLTGAHCEDSSYMVIDLDHCLDENGALKSKKVQLLLNKFKGAHIEVSPSGTGLHVWAWVPGLKKEDLKGNVYTLPDGQRVELYFDGRYITLTGNVYGGDDARVKERLNQTPLVKATVNVLERIKREQAAKEAVKKGTLTKAPATTAPAKSVDDKRAAVPKDLEPLPDDEVIKRAGKVSTYGALFTRLYAGDISDYGNDRSKAAMAFFNFLPFWTRGDEEQMLRIFKKSGLNTCPDDIRKAVDYDIPEARRTWNGKYYDPGHNDVTPESWDDELIDSKTVKKASESPSKPVKGRAGIKAYDGKYTAFKDQPKRLRCADWTADDLGIRRDVPKGKSSVTVYASTTPMLPVAILTDKDGGGQLVQIAYRLSDGVWRTTTVAREDLASNRKIVDVLARLGINGVTTNTAKETVKYFDDVLSLNTPETGLEDLTRVSHAGWVDVKDGKGNTSVVFAPYIEKVVTAFNGDELTLDDFKGRGALDKWVQAAAQLRELPMARVALAASFAAPLVKLLDVQSGIVHFVGQSGYGKTMILNAAASVWGRPKKFVRSFDQTPYSGTVRAALLANIPVCLDELQTARSQNGYDQLIYRFVEGVSRGQGKKDGGNKKPLHWDTLFITTGEESIVSPNSQGGAVNRVLDAEVTEPMFEDPGRRDLIRVMCRNCGQAGRVYIERITTEWVDEKGSLDALQQRYDLYNDLLAMTSTGKQAALGALLCLGDELARACFWPAETMDLTELIMGFLKDDTQVDPSIRAYHFIMDMVASNGACFEGSSKMPAWGKFPEKGGVVCDHTRVYFLKTKLTQVLSDAGYDFRALQKPWVKQGVLVKHGKNLDMTTTVNGVRCRIVELRLDIE